MASGEVLEPTDSMFSHETSTQLNFNTHKDQHSVNNCLKRVVLSVVPRSLVATEVCAPRPGLPIRNSERQYHKHHNMRESSGRTPRASHRQYIRFEQNHFNTFYSPQSVESKPVGMENLGTHLCEAVRAFPGDSNYTVPFQEKSLTTSSGFHKASHNSHLDF